MGEIDQNDVRRRFRHAPGQRRFVADHFNLEFAAFAQTVDDHHRSFAISLNDDDLQHVSLGAFEGDVRENIAAHTFFRKRTIRGSKFNQCWQNLVSRRRLADKRFSAFRLPGVDADRDDAVPARDEADMWRGGRPVQNSMMQSYWRDIWGADWRPVYGYDQD